MTTRPSILLVTDLTYQARGRRYCDEDIALAGKLREHFDVALCNPLDAVAMMAAFDVVMVRNSGPVMNYVDAYERFCTESRARGTKVFNELRGKADMVDKEYLPTLWDAGYPVIPTVRSSKDLGRLPTSERYVVKLINGADSEGMEFKTFQEVSLDTRTDILIQPMVDFRYEVSFYFIGNQFQYALNAPDPDMRWELVPYAPSAADLEFAQSFIDWNDIQHGIQRVDACRTRDGQLLLVELEDLNPYLSLDAVPEDVRNSFYETLVAALRTQVREG